MVVISSNSQIPKGIWMRKIAKTSERTMLGALLSMHKLLMQKQLNVSEA